MGILTAARESVRRSQAVLRGVSVTYTRPVDGGPDISIEITRAVQGRVTYEAEHPRKQVAMRELIQHWLIESAELVNDAGSRLDPQRGDTITTCNGTVYRVMPEGNGGRLWRWMDEETQTRMRIYTKERS